MKCKNCKCNQMMRLLSYLPEKNRITWICDACTSEVGGSGSNFEEARLDASYKIGENFSHQLALEKIKIIGTFSQSNENPAQWRGLL